MSRTKLDLKKKMAKHKYLPYIGIVRKLPIDQVKTLHYYLGSEITEHDRRKLEIIISWIAQGPFQNKNNLLTTNSMGIDTRTFIF